jgi:hypothetical protein
LTKAKDKNESIICQPFLGRVTRLRILPSINLTNPLTFEPFTISGDGQVGIGGTPTWPLEIFSTQQYGSPFLRAVNNLGGGEGEALLGVNNNIDAGQCFLFSPLGSIYVGHSGFQKPVIELNGYGNQGEEVRLFVSVDNIGYVQADVKNFRIDHPIEKGKEIWYACIEGPEAAAYERGTSKLVNGQSEVTFSEHFQFVISSESMTVQITPLSAESKGIAVVEKTATGFKVKELMGGHGNYQFDWEVKCIRKGYEDYEVIREKEDSTPLRPSIRPED